MKSILAFVACAFLLAQGSRGFVLSGLETEVKHLGEELVTRLMSGSQELAAAMELAQQAQGHGFFGFNYGDCEKLPEILGESKDVIAQVVMMAAKIAMDFQNDTSELMKCTQASLFQIGQCFTEKIGALKELETNAKAAVVLYEGMVKDVAAQLKIYFMACIGRGTIPTTTTPTTTTTTAAPVVTSTAAAPTQPATTQAPKTTAAPKKA